MDYHEFYINCDIVSFNAWLDDFFGTQDLQEWVITRFSTANGTIDYSLPIKYRPKNRPGRLWAVPITILSVIPGKKTQVQIGEMGNDIAEINSIPFVRELVYKIFEIWGSSMENSNNLSHPFDEVSRLPIPNSKKKKRERTSQLTNSYHKARADQFMKLVEQDEDKNTPWHELAEKMIPKVTINPIKESFGKAGYKWPPERNNH